MHSSIQPFIIIKFQPPAMNKSHPMGRRNGFTNYKMMEIKHQASSLIIDIHLCFADISIMVVSNKWHAHLIWTLASSFCDEDQCRIH
uniref:Uncharacterized protein n=1 Tax=Arundo donax TaxID=35708 RepID=A0A0A9E609_ARUDO